jgi:hypothetical protein
MSFQ